MVGKVKICNCQGNDLPASETVVKLKQRISTLLLHRLVYKNVQQQRMTSNMQEI